MPNTESLQQGPSTGNELTFGQKNQRLQRSTGVELADQFKQKVADLMDFLKQHEHLDPRLCATTIIHLEVSSTIGVKMLTAGA